MATGERPFTLTKLGLDDDQLPIALEGSKDLVEQSKELIISSTLTAGLGSRALIDFLSTAKMNANNMVFLQVGDFSIDDKKKAYKTYADRLRDASLDLDPFTREGRPKLDSIVRDYGKALLFSCSLQDGDGALMQLRHSPTVTLPVATVREGRNDVIDAISEPIEVVLQAA